MSRVVLLHGFTQTAASWASVSAALSADHDVVALDAPGHGGHGDVAADLWVGARLLGDEGGSGAYIGYSMGGRFALHLALLDPARVRALVLVSATAGIEDAGERAARRAADDALADRVEAVGVSTFLDEWLAQPMFAGLTPEAQDRAARAGNTAAGLASSLRAAGTGTQEPLWSRLHELSIPVLVVTGERDARFREIGERLVAGARDASLVVIEGAGHAAPFERPEAFVAAVAPWIAARA